MSYRSFTLAASVLALSGALPGCVLEKRDAGDEFREAVPLHEAVVVAGPETDSAAQSSSASLAGRRAALANEPWANGPYAKWYGFTRSVRGSVNAITGAVLGGAWVIVHSDPSSVDNGEAIWGPYTDALEPVTYRFRVTRVADAEFDYVLEGRPKASSSDGDYRAVLFGHGYGKRHEQHGQGEFTIDLDVARELDPFGAQDDSGSLRIVHDLPRDIARRGDALPRTIVAEARPNPAVSPEWFTVTSAAKEDGTGTLHVDSFADVDDSKLTLPEDIVIDSQWRADGAGRADILISSGDVPADPGLVSAVECWGADFMRSHYSDSIGFEPAEGDASACVYDAPPGG